MPFWGLTLQNCHPTEPCAVYTDKERRFLCALRGVPEIHCSTHLTSDVHAEQAVARWALRHLPTNNEAVLVLRTLQPDLLAHPQVGRDDVILDMDAKTMCDILCRHFCGGWGACGSHARRQAKGAQGRCAWHHCAL